MKNFEKRLDAAKRGSTLQLLFKCSRILNERALASFPEGDPAGAARPAHLALFPHIDLRSGTRITDIAARLEISKQAVGQLVDDLVEFGVVQRTQDPEDGRAKRVQFTDRGKSLMLDGLRHLKQVEAQLSRELGRDVMQSLHKSLLTLHDHLEVSEE